MPFVGDQDGLVDEIARFLASARTQIDGDRVLVTLLCVDVPPSRPRGRQADAASAFTRLRRLVVEEASRFG